MFRAVLTTLFTGFVLLAPLNAQSFELKPKKIRLSNDTADVFPELELRRLSSLADSIKQPRYKSTSPQRFSTLFGTGEPLEVAFAGDEQKGAGKGFDSLFADIAGEGNLSKGKRLSGKPVRAGSSTEDTTFPPFKVEVPGGDDEIDYSVQARLVVSRTSPSDKTPRDSTLYLTSLCCLEGDVELGGKKQRMIVFDANCNGAFGERGAPNRGSGAPSGDKVWIGSGSPKLEEAYIEALPLGKYTLFEGAYYEVSVGEDHFAQIQPAAVPLGKLKVSNPGFLLELAQGGDVLYVSNDEGTDLDIPVGEYRMITPGFRAKYKGAVWELQGNDGSLRESFSIDEGGETAVAVGPPIKLVVTSTVSNTAAGLIATLKFDMVGSQGEKYKYLRKDGKKVALPEVSIRDEKGREVKKGRFEYG